MSKIDTGAESVARVRRLLIHPDGVWRAHAEEAGEMIGALVAERDKARAEAARLRRGWLTIIQVENSCGGNGAPCDAKRCGCLEEMEMLMREDDAIAALAQEPRHD